MTRDEAISDLAQVAKAGPTFRGQLETLIFYLEKCGLIEDREDKLTATKATPKSPALPTEGPEQSEMELNTESVSETRSVSVSKAPFGMMSDGGAVQFSINVQVDMKEFAGWSADRISAFFSGIAAVLAARGEDQVIKE